MPLQHNNLLARFRRHLQTQVFIQRGEKLLLAISGGLDSRVLLDLFLRTQSEWDWQLLIGHVQHQLRGDEAEGDETFVAELARSHGLPFYCKRLTVQTFAQEKKLSLETARRELRYKALAEMCAECGATVIVTAHTQDDQAETILAHILRGSGLRGLRGMQARSVISETKFDVLRPLLSFPRPAILAYAQARALKWREDSSNTDVRFRRNRVRHELLPLLRERFNPRINASLIRLASIAGESEAQLQANARQAFVEALLAEEMGKIILDLLRFRNYFRAVQAYVIRAVLERVTSTSIVLTFEETEQILSFLNPTQNQLLAFPRRRYLWRSEVEIYTEKTGVVFSKIQPTPQPQFLEIGQRCVLHDAGLAITITPVANDAFGRGCSHADLQFIDAGTITGRLRVRFPQAGDRFMPLGMSGLKKKLSDFFIDEKVPLARRAHMPLITCEAGIVWICGYRLDERFKITPRTQNILQLQVEWLSKRKHDPFE